jgi:negative regulator of flagellin synthesis FlgM
MRIGNTPNTPVQGSETSATQSKGKAGDAKAAQAAKDARKAVATDGAKSEISDRGREIASVKTAAVSAPDVREEKVAELKRRIASGQYKTDASAIADKMVDEHLQTADMG